MAADTQPQNRLDDGMPNYLGMERELQKSLINLTAVVTMCCGVRTSRKGKQQYCANNDSGGIPATQQYRHHGLAAFALNAFILTPRWR